MGERDGAEEKGGENGTRKKQEKTGKRERKPHSIGIYATKGGGNRVGEEQRGNGRRTEEREEHIEKHPCRIRRKMEWDIS